MHKIDKSTQANIFWGDLSWQAARVQNIVRISLDPNLKGLKLICKNQLKKKYTAQKNGRKK